MLLPRLNSSRYLLDLCGIWKFHSGNTDLDDNYLTVPFSDFETIAVPASYNDQKTDKSLRDHYGWVYYQTHFSIPKAMDNEMKYWEQFNKPVIITEYGADAVSGVHNINADMFSEEYQVEFFKAINTVLDKYPYIIGEHVWNFADFDTIQGLMRVGGNKKGVFTRNRQPKSLAYYLKDRWSKIV